MTPYCGMNRHHTGIHRTLTREYVATILRRTRAIDRQDARDWRNWLIWLGTYPLKRRSEISEQRITAAFLKRYHEERKGEK